MDENQKQDCSTFKAHEFKVMRLRECPTPKDLLIADTPAKTAEYWRLHVQTHPYFNPDVECFVVLLLSTRRHVRGHALISTGTLDTLLVHPREVFRPAIVGAASAIVLMHNHPSGDPTPSEADIRITRELIKGGQILKIDVLDHVVMGHVENVPPFVSLRELGYFYS